MSDQNIRSEMLRIAAGLPKGDPTRRKLLASLKQSYQDFNFGDDIDEEYLPRGWFKALQAVRAATEAVQMAIGDYGEAQEFISRMEIPPKVVELAKRGMNTARHGENQWNAISDDPYSMMNAYRDAVDDGWKPRHLR